MADINLEKMSLKELKSLKRKVDKAIDGYEDRVRREALAALEDKARELGFSLSELTKGAKKPKVAAKYANPADPRQTWSGRGRKPGWFLDAIAKGSDVSDLEIS